MGVATARLVCRSRAYAGPFPLLGRRGSWSQVTTDNPADPPPGPLPPHPGEGSSSRAAGQRSGRRVGRRGHPRRGRRPGDARRGNEVTDEALPSSTVSGGGDDAPTRGRPDAVRSRRRPNPAPSGLHPASAGGLSTRRPGCPAGRTRPTAGSTAADCRSPNSRVGNRRGSGTGLTWAYDVGGQDRGDRAGVVRDVRGRSALGGGRVRGCRPRPQSR